jgi:hypothetical protein
MKMKALAALCKKESTYHLFDRKRDYNENKPVLQQWLGVGGALYILPDLPYLSEGHIAALFDVAESKKGLIKTGEFPESLCGEDSCPGECLLDPEEITITYGERIVRPYMTREGLEFINVEFLKPLADYGVYLELYERRTDSGQLYFAAKNGLMLVGIIMPVRIDEGLVDDMEKLAVKARAAFRLKKEREERQITAPGQMDLGELVDAHIAQTAKRHGVEAGGA